MDTNTMRARLRWARETGGLSRRALSLLAGLDESHVRLIEEGARDNPTQNTFVPLARVVGCTLDWLVLGVGDAPSESDVLAAVARARLAAQPSAEDPRPSHPMAA